MLDTIRLSVKVRPVPSLPQIYDAVRQVTADSDTEEESEPCRPLEENVALKIAAAAAMASPIRPYATPALLQRHTLQLTSNVCLPRIRSWKDVTPVATKTTQYFVPLRKIVKK